MNIPARKTIVVSKASAVVDPIPELEIVVCGEVPEMRDLAESRVYYRTQAKALAAALRESLPGGTVNALLIELLEAQASLLRVPG